MRALADNGISMLGVPEEFGGIPADYVTQMLALMEVSKCGAPHFDYQRSMYSGMRRFGSAEQLRKTAESTTETGDPAYAGIDGPGAGSDNNVPLPLTRVKRQGLHQRTETSITGAKEYPYMLVLARDPQPERSERPLLCGGSTPVSPALKSIHCIKSAGICSAPAKVYLDNVEVEETT